MFSDSLSNSIDSYVEAQANFKIKFHSTLVPETTNVPHPTFGLDPELACKRTPEEQLYDSELDAERPEPVVETEADIEQVLLDYNC